MGKISATAAQIEKWNKELKPLTLKESFDFIISKAFGKIVFTTSFGQEDQLITHHIAQNSLPIEVATLDTGRLFQETYEVFHKTTSAMGQEIQTYFPDTKAVEDLVNSKGPNSFYESIENRKECCGIRKIEPLKRALQGADLWITGLRAAQSENRATMPFLSFDPAFGVLKFNPLLYWTLEEVCQYLDSYKLPQNSLHKKGYISIGCAPCTRAVEPGAPSRSGRWWWEQSQKECGLHHIHKTSH